MLRKIPNPSLLPGQDDGIKERDRERILRFIGGRWAVKEAARKAVGAERCAWKDVLVRVREGGALDCVIRTKESVEKGIKRDFMEEEHTDSKMNVENEPVRRLEVEQRYHISRDEDKGQVAMCSISHDGEYVTAMVLAVREDVTSLYYRKEKGEENASATE